MTAMQATTGMDVVPPAGAVSWRRRIEVLALLYLLLISSGAHGFVDLLAFGRGFSKTDASLLSQLLWPAAYLLFGALIVVARHEVLAVLRHCRWTLAFPAVVALSVLWSSEPAASLNGAIRVGMTTMMAVLIGTRFDLHEITRAVFMVLAAAVLFSLFSAMAGLDYAQMKDGALRGVFHHKNMMGSRAALLFGTGLALVVAGWRPGIALAGLAAALLAVVLSKSAAGVAVAAVAVIVLPVAVILRAQWTALIFALLVLGMVISSAAFAVVLFQVNPVLEILAALGRDLTLTGRILLWEAGLEYFQARPLLGTGFDAFWHGRLDWRILIVLDDLGDVLHFHNSFLEVAVQLGAAGLLAVAVTVSGFARAGLMALRHRADPLAPFIPIFAAIAVAVSMVEAEIFLQHKVMHVLLVALGVAATRQTLLAAARAAWPGQMPVPPSFPQAEAVHADHRP